MTVSRELVEGVFLTALADASRDLLEGCLDSVADTLQVPSSTIPAMFERFEAAQAGRYPDALWLLEDEFGPAGWAGWAPYLEVRGGWQTTTYFAPRLRGRRLIAPVRCLQVHAMPVVRSFLAAGAVEPPWFVSSVSVHRPWSLRASKRYAHSASWPDTWELVHEPQAGRDAFVFTWPQHDPPHPCFQP